uniref:Uncharacterized protein n=1 Tax=Romanomermis culicivorax TaxID=13658 RepID=A0A915IJH2_ROMCU
MYKPGDIHRRELIKTVAGVTTGHPNITLVTGSTNILKHILFDVELLSPEKINFFEKVLKYCRDDELTPIAWTLA